MTVSRHILHPGNADAVDFLLAELKAICGPSQAHTDPFEHDGETYHNVWAEISGTTNELVVIGAHLDSTAANSRNYHAATSAAPGADDDASGVIAVLEIAQSLKTLAAQKTPRRSIRFVLFNAEEQLMVGSSDYARDLKEAEADPAGPTVAAMFAMDMIGWHPAGTPPFAFEIHGTGDGPGQYASAKSASDQIAAILEQTAIQLAATSLAPQVYPLKDCDKDPATNHSDHSMFHYQDWAACLVSEDQFVEACGRQLKTNPHYHKETDLPEHVDFDYVADIARIVAEAAWVIANQ